MLSVLRGGDAHIKRTGVLMVPFRVRMFKTQKVHSGSFRFQYLLHLYRALQGVNSLFAVNTFGFNEKHSPASHPAD